MPYKNNDFHPSKGSRLYFQTINQNGYEKDPYAKEFGITVDEKLASVEARVLPAPWVMFNIPFSLIGYFDMVWSKICSSILFLDSLNITIPEKKKNICRKLVNGIWQTR